MLKFWSIIVGVMAVGCGSSHEMTSGSHETHDSGVDETTDSAVTDTGSPAESGALDTPSAVPATPSVTMVMPMAGAWHVAWNPNDTGLTKIELWRSNDGAEATLVKALAGTAKDWHDSAAPGTTVKYCYKVRSLRGADTSEYSAEKCSK